jgi:hypothetical protein
MARPLDDRAVPSLAMMRLALLLAVACGTKESGSKGPAYTPAIANELAVLTPSCETEPGTAGVMERRKCKGNQVSAIIALDSRRHFVNLEIELNAWLPKLARDRIDRALGPLLTKPVLARLSEGLEQPVHEGTLEGVTYRTTMTGANPAHYTLSLTW